MAEDNETRSESEHSSEHHSESSNKKKSKILGMSPLLAGGVLLGFIVLVYLYEKSHKNTGSAQTVASGSTYAPGGVSGSAPTTGASNNTGMGNSSLTNALDTIGADLTTIEGQIASNTTTTTGTSGNSNTTTTANPTNVNPTLASEGFIGASSPTAVNSYIAQGYHTYYVNNGYLAPTPGQNIAGDLNAWGTGLPAGTGIYVHRGPIVTTPVKVP